MELDLSVSGKAVRKNRSKGLIDHRVPIVSADHALNCLEQKFCSRYRRVKDAFVHMDYDCDGKISSSEFRVTLDLMGLVMVDSEYEKLWRYFDVDGNGKIDYTEFNNKVGYLIHPPITRHIINRESTPRVRKGNARRLAILLKKRMNNLESAFSMIDSDGSGYISHAEFIQALRHVGLTKIGHEESYALMMAHKTEDDGHDGLSLEQFKDTMEAYLKVPEATAAAKAAGGAEHPLLKLNHAEKLLSEKLWGKFSAVQRAFRLFDEDKSGELSYAEFRSALRSLSVNLTDPDFKELVSKYDANGDGSISYDEFNTQVGSLIHPDAVNTNKGFNAMTEGAGAQESALHFNPHAKMGRHAVDEDVRAARTLSARAALLAPRMSCTQGEAYLVQQLHGRFKDLQMAFRKYDKDSSGTLNREEFKNLCYEMKVHLTDKAMEELSLKYDPSGEGRVSYDDLNARIGPLLHDNPGMREVLAMSEDTARALAEEREAHFGPDSVASSQRVSVSGEGEEKESEGEGKSSMESEAGDEVTSLHSLVAGTGAGGPSVPKLQLRTASGRTRGSLAGSRYTSARREDDTVSIATSQWDLEVTEEKMRKVLGRSWKQVYRGMKRKQAKEGGPGLSTGRFRDELAEKGVPLTSKEVRALAQAYPPSGRHSSRGSHVDYGSLLKNAFAGSAGGSSSRRRAVAARAPRSSGRRGGGGPLSGAMSARLSSSRSTAASEISGSLRGSRR